jgi:hypothetical protein
MARRRETGWDIHELHQEMEDGIVIREARGGGYRVTASGRTIDEADTMRGALSIARRWSERNNYYPNIFFVNDHGNVDLLSSRGRVFESWV